MQDDRMTPRLLHFFIRSMVATPSPFSLPYASSHQNACLLARLSLPCLHIVQMQPCRPQLCRVATMTSNVPSPSLWLLSLEATVNVVFAVSIKDMMCLYTSGRGNSAGGCYCRGSATFQAKSFPLAPAIVLPWQRPFSSASPLFGPLDCYELF